MINLVIMAKNINSICTDCHTISNDFLKGIIAMPARRALQKEKIDSLEKLSNYSEDELMQLHGFGKTTISKLKMYLKDNNTSLKI